MTMSCTAAGPVPLPATTPASTAPEPTAPAPTVGGGEGGLTPELLTSLQGVVDALSALTVQLQASGGAMGGGGAQTGCAQMQQADAGATGPMSQMVADATGGDAGAAGPMSQMVADATLSRGAQGAPSAPHAHGDTKPKKSKPKSTAATAPTGPTSAPAGTKLVMPVDGAKVTSKHGEVSSTRGGKPHSGTDLAKPTGAPIKAAAGGKVVEVGNDGDGYGRYLTIDHGNGWFTRYAHASAIHVQKGATVGAGQVIAKVGSTGNSTGPHLHFEVLKGSTKWGSQVDAAPYLSGAKTF